MRNSLLANCIHLFPGPFSCHYDGGFPGYFWSELLHHMALFWAAASLVPRPIICGLEIRLGCCCIPCPVYLVIPCLVLHTLSSPTYFVQSTLSRPAYLVQSYIPCTVYLVQSCIPCPVLHTLSRPAYLVHSFHRSRM